MNHQAFLQAIREAPDDDLLRLACADFFEEQGDPARAEMIRLQIELSRGVADRAAELGHLRRLYALIVTHRAAWLGALAEVGPGAVLQRGFVEEVRLSPLALSGYAEAILERHPITRVILEGPCEGLDGLVACPAVAHVESLRYREAALADADAGLLARSPHLGRLRRLDLESNRLTAAGLAALAEGPGLAGLHELRLARNAIAGPLGRFVAAAGLPGLRVLDLSSNRIDTRGAAALAGPSSWLGRLEELHLSYNGLSPADVERLADSPHLAGVGRLYLYQARLPGGVARRLKDRHGERVQV